jgi:poly-gamma-glutamate capsule biosynthesis protein CapA/YwtB (metallophosphatase superfamily)
MASTLQPGTGAQDSITLCLGGDVMTGRGIDQIQRHRCDPRLYEPWVHDARDYRRLAEQANGPIPAPVDPAYCWGEALAEIEARQPDLRLINLETAITARGAPWPGKGIHYRMHPDNLGMLTAARPDCCVLANNHVLDWGREGLDDTLAVLAQAGIAHAGAGPDAAAAEAPAVLPLPGGGRLLVFARATADSGVMEDWPATAQRSGVALLDGLGEASAQAFAAEVARWRRPGDLVLLSVHWGGNWGADVPAPQRRFARRLVDLGAVDLVHGHSSHHARAPEVWRGRLIVYGCGDLINDYEGIGREGPYDPAAVCLWFPRLARDGALQGLEVVPLRLRRLQLVRADAEARHSLRALLLHDSARTGIALADQADSSWRVGWRDGAEVAPRG